MQETYPMLQGNWAKLQGGLYHMRQQCGNRPCPLRTRQKYRRQAKCYRCSRLNLSSEKHMLYSLDSSSCSYISTMQLHQEVQASMQQLQALRSEMRSGINVFDQNRYLLQFTALTHTSQQSLRFRSHLELPLQVWKEQPL